MVAKGYKLIRSRQVAQQVQLCFRGIYFGSEDPTTKRYTEHGGTTEIIPLFDVYIEVVIDPKFVDEWPFPVRAGGDLGHTWRITACKQEKPCK